MIDHKKINNKEVTLDEVCGHLGPAELRDLTNEMTDTLLDLIVGCVDEDVVFMPKDPEAYDNAAATEGDVHLPWSLGHLIVHITASSEEAAFLGAELARGVQREGRSRYETYWTTMTTINQCRARLEESRRMQLATLEVWPDEPHMDNTIELRFREGPINPASRFCGGLLHASSHIEQVIEVVRQAKAARA